MAKKINKKNVAIGAIEPNESESVYAFMGRNTFPYKQNDVNEYRLSLVDMTFSDLQRHAIEIAGIIPNTNKREQLIDKLEREFLRKKFQFVNRTVAQTASTLSDIEEKSIKDLLSRGR
jgi:hypothetical protein